MLDSSRIRVRGLVLTAACTAALGLAACGDDDDDSATSPTTTAETTETTDTTDVETTEDETTTETTEQTTDDSGGTSEPEGDVADVLRSQLEAAGIKADQADCVIDELESTLGEEALQELQDTEAPSQEVIDASTAAAQTCLSP